MVQRLPDKHDDGEAYARWEFPGGRLDGGDGEADPSVWAGAVREWEEETGGHLPEGAEPCGGWVSEDEEYEGFVVCVPHESDISLDPQPEEVSRAAWWAPEDLDDPKVREKVTEQLGDIKPLLKAQWSDFHRHTDAIVAHFTPMVQDAMAQVIEGDAVRHAVRVAYTAQKGTQIAATALQPTAPGSQNKPKYQAHVAALSGAANILPAAGAAAALAGQTLAQAGPPLTVAHLLGSALSTTALAAVLGRLYANATAQGAYEASIASGRPLPTSGGLPEGYWDHWEPGHEDIATQLAGQTMVDLLAQAHITIKGITETQLHRIGEAIDRAVRDGVPMKQAVAQVEAIVHDPERAALIAETEYARGVTAARRAAYQAAHVPQLAWLHQPGACERCLENAAASPISIRDSWPQGNVPVHPNCRCVEVPYDGR